MSVMLMLFGTLFFLGLFIIFVFLLLGQEKVIKTVRQELDVQRQYLSSLEQRLAMAENPHKVNPSKGDTLSLAKTQAPYAEGPAVPSLDMPPMQASQQRTAPAPAPKPHLAPTMELSMEGVSSEGAAYRKAASSVKIAPPASQVRQGAPSMAVPPMEYSQAEYSQASARPVGAAAMGHQPQGGHVRSQSVKPVGMQNDDLQLFMAPPQR